MRARLRLAFSATMLLVFTLSTPAQDYTARVDPQLVYVDNFEGWGTSLCWWANLVGGYANRSTYASLCFTQLKLNLVRYNIGGGENPAISNTMEFRAQMPGFQPSPGVWDWTADANQRWMLREAVARGADRVVAFANSPPWWMTVSGSVTGSTNGTSNNLQTGYEDDFAIYFATVMSNLTLLDNVRFESATPMNEPTASWWKYGGRQEGCHMDAAQQARLINLLRQELNARGQTAGLVGSEDSDEQSAINSVNAYDGAARSNLLRVVTHTYGANNPTGVRNVAASLRKPAWISEYGDGDASGLPMARRIHDDLTGTWARGWVYWQFVDNAGGWGMLYNALDRSGNTSYTVNKKYYVMGQFSQFVRPGNQLFSVSDANTLAAYNPTNRTLTLVAVNDTTNAFTVDYDLGAFSQLPASAARYRTSPTENLATIAGLAVMNRHLASTLPARSVTTHVLANVTPATPSSAPLAWYPLEGDALDASGNGLNGTISGGVGFVTGRLGAKAAQFDGTGYIEIPRCISNHWTISFWCKTTGSGGTGQWWAGRGLVDGEVSGPTDDFGVSLVGSKAGFGVGSPDVTIASTGSINDGQWHHVAATRDAVSGEMKLYVDGALQTTGYGPVGAKTAPPSLHIGSIQTGSSGGYFSGTLDDVQLFPRVFLASEVPGLMNHVPSIAAVSGTNVLAGRTLMLSNSAGDPDLPAQTLRWSLPGAPAGAALNATNGLLSWRPAVAQSPSTNLLQVVVTDNGVPALSATQTVSVVVGRPANPVVSGVQMGAGFGFQVSGDWGPDYVVEASTNLTSNWAPVSTNLSAVTPFGWLDPRASNYMQRFYRVRLGP